MKDERYPEVFGQWCFSIHSECHLLSFPAFEEIPFF